jgi:hypothetical protein
MTTTVVNDTVIEVQPEAPKGVGVFYNWLEPV